MTFLVEWTRVESEGTKAGRKKGMGREKVEDQLGDGNEAVVHEDDTSCQSSA